jgi:hypothetical protein
MKIIYDERARFLTVQVTNDQVYESSETADGQVVTNVNDNYELVSIEITDIREKPELEVIEKVIDPNATPVRLAVVADNYGLYRGWEQDVTDIVQHFESEGFSVTLVGKSVSIVVVADRDCDVLVVDYGRADVGTNGDAGLAIDTARRAYTWAREHPGRLLILWTGFTARTYREVAEEIEAEDLDNVVMMANYDDNTEQWQQIKRWCGAS